MAMSNAEKQAAYRARRDKAFRELLCPECWQLKLSGPCAHMSRLEIRTAADPNIVLGELTVPARHGGDPGPYHVVLLSGETVTVTLGVLQTSDPAIDYFCIRATEPLEFWRTVRGFIEA